jgi:DNA repair exonuclease SbcCD ATPase subunit
MEGGKHMEDVTTQNIFSPFEEASKALLNLILGSDEYNQLAQNMVDYFDLIEQNNSLLEEVASLKEKPPYKDKYENLRVEFQKVASERDQLRAQELEMKRIKSEYNTLKSKYQSTLGQLATLQRSIEDTKSSINQWSALESLYQVFKGTCAKAGVDIRRIPCQVDLQFILQDRQNSQRGSSYGFVRTSKTNWKRVR